MKALNTLLPAVLALTAVSCISDDPDEPDAFVPHAIPVRVLEYHPAPGQFVNVLPACDNSSVTYADMLRRAESDISQGYVVTLGALGGNIVFKLLEPVTNHPGVADICVHGNAYLTGLSQDGKTLSSSEPGIVEVMEDTNGNGLPDDGPWIALRGEHWDDARRVAVTYTTDEQEHILASIPGQEAMDVSTGSWYHTQPFTPLWEGALRWDAFSTFMLPANGFLDSNGLYRMYAYDGYADSYPNNDTRANLNLDNATTPVSRIDFVRISTGVLQSNGPLGECSTEVGPIFALHK